MKSKKYLSVYNLLAKLDRDVGMEQHGIDESDVIEWIGEALEGIGCVQQYEEAVAFIEVKDHQCTLPSNFHAIIQIARDNCWESSNKSSGICPSVIVEETTDTTPKAHIPVPLDCDGKPIVEYELAYYRPYFDLQYSYGAWIGSATYRNRFTPVRLATGAFRSLVCELTDSPQSLRALGNSGEDSYTIIGGTTLRFNFREGQIALAYLRQELDSETGYPMVPDIYSVKQAITNYILTRVFSRDFYAGREGAKGKMDRAEADWQYYCGQASNEYKMLYGIDAYQNMLDQRNYLIPRLSEYYGFFGRLNQAEDRKFNNPDRRNIRY